MHIRHVLWLLIFSQAVRADVFTIQLVNENHSASIISTSSRNPGGSGILFGPGPGIEYLTSSLRCFVGCLFGDPSNDDRVADLLTLENPGSPSSPTQTELYLPFQFGDFTPVGGCSAFWPACVPAQNGVVYPLGNISYTDGTTDSFYFEWIMMPEPSGLVLMGTVAIGICMLARKRAHSVGQRSS